MKNNTALKLVGAILLCEAAGFFGTLFTMPAIESGWYATLEKSALTPPDFVFGPVWTALYALMGVALFLVWRGEALYRLKRRAAHLFFIQLALNVLWSFLFFGLQSPLAALADIAVLWLMIISTIIAFAKCSRAAAWLFLPYLLWVSFAAYLNYTIVILNL